MTPRTFFVIALRVLGIFLLKDFILAIPTMFTLALQIFQSDSNGLGEVVSVLIYLGGWALIFVVLFAKAPVLVDKFQLTSGIRQDRLDVKVETSTVLRLALFITAGMLLVTEIPELLHIIIQAAFFKQTDYETLAGESYDWQPVIFSVLKIVLALLLIGERNRIIEAYERRQPIPKDDLPPVEERKDLFEE